MKSASGFTISEIVVVTAILGVMILFAVGIFIANNRLFNTEAGENLAVMETRNAGDLIGQYGRGAVAVVASYIYNSVTYNSDADTVVFRLPALDATNQIIAATYDYIIITRDPGNSNRLLLILNPNPGSGRKARNRELTDHLVSLSLGYDNPDFSLVKSVTYDLRVTYSGRNPATEQISGTVTLRN